MGLTRKEQETTIIFNREEETMRICTASRPLIAKLEKMDGYEKIGEEWDGDRVISATFTANKRLVRLRDGFKNLTEEQREVARELMRGINDKRKIDSSTKILRINP